MSLICNIVGHKWDKSDMYHQDWVRNGCLATRYVYVKKYPKFGEPASGWKIIDVGKIKIK